LTESRDEADGHRAMVSSLSQKSDLAGRSVAEVQSRLDSQITANADLEKKQRRFVCLRGTEGEELVKQRRFVCLGGNQRGGACETAQVRLFGRNRKGGACETAQVCLFGRDGRGGA